MDTYITVKAPSTNEIKIKGSRFLGQITPVSSREDARTVLESIRKQYHDATHHCYAYRLNLQPPFDFRYSDDGEPSGTAGRPIFNVLEGRKLTQVICIVTRYFGGIKLGPGGLVRAYQQCTKELLNQCNLITKYIMLQCSVTFDFSLTGIVMELISKYGAQIIETQYQDKTKLHLEVCQGKFQPFCHELTNRTHGDIIIL